MHRQDRGLEANISPFPFFAFKRCRQEGKGGVEFLNKNPHPLLNRYRE